MMALLGTAACSRDIAARGNVPKPDKLAEVQPGSSKEDVIAAIGSPSSVGTFNDKVWYYVGQTTQDFAFFPTEVLDRKVVAITFDADNRVAEVKNLNLDNSQDVQMVSRTTPTVGRDVNLFNQLFSNLGKSPAVPGMGGPSGPTGPGGGGIPGGGF